MASLFESFELTAMVLDRPEGSLHQARDRQTNALFLLQRPPAALPFEEARQQLLRESGVLGQLVGVPGVARLAGLVQGASGGALILKYFPGVSLGNVPPTLWADTGQLLEGCLGLTALVEGIHRAGFLHRDLHPGSFLFDKTTGQFLLVGFGQASPAAEDRRSNGGPDRVSDWGYLAPEQTGRINIPVDRRTDYYALGMVLYTLATGDPAFAVQSPLEAVHAHLAKVPPAPRGCPSPLAEILLKLLAKNPDQRYQSLTGLTADLTRCRDQWHSGVLTPFALGSEDLADRLRPTRKLFGREQETALLNDLYQRTASGTSESLVIAGPSGSGKTALATEAGSRALGDQGFFLVGKFDETRKDQPYSAFVQQVEDLVRHTVRRPDRESWRRIFADSLGDNQAVIVALEPSFEALCGPQAPPPPLPPRETENRLFYTLESFMRALLSTERPVVLLFDDIQWIDPASIRLLESLGSQTGSGRLLSLYAYRNNEEVVSEGFPAFLSRLEASSRQPTLNLGSLDAAAVEAWVEEVLGTARDTEVLAKNLVAKTAGSPFFLSRLVQRLCREGILFYDRSHRRWDWNSQQLMSLPASENVSDLLVSQIDALPTAARSLLGIAACLGTTVASADLAPFASLVPDLATALWPLIDQQYVVPLSDGYLALAAPEYREGKAEVGSFSFRFQHDKIRQAARDGMAPEARSEVHMQAARWLEGTRPGEAVGHYLTVLDKITTLEARLRLVRLLIKVAQAARASSASHQALDLFHRAQDLARALTLPEDEAQQLLLLLAETAYLCHEIDEAEAVSQALLDRLSDPGAKAEVFQMQMDAFTFLGRMTDALERGQRALAVLGVKLALKPNPLVLASALLRVTAKSGRQTPEALFDRTGQTPVRIRTLLRLLGKFLVPAQMSGNVNLFVLSTLMTADLALTHPNTDETSGAFGNFAILLSVLGRHRQAYDFASLALRLEEARPNPKTAAGVHSAYAFFSLPWNRPWAEVPPACRRGAEAAVRAGDLFYIAYQNLFSTVFSPSPVLDESIAALQATLQIVAGTHQDDAVVGGTFALRRWQALASTKDKPFDFSGAGFDEASAVQAWEAKKNLSGLAVYHLYKTQVLFTLGRYDEAWAQWQAGQPAASSIQGSAYMEEYSVVTVLVCAERARTNRRQKGVLPSLTKEAKRLAAWARTCPENFAALSALAQAEMLAAKGRTKAAAQGFADAINEAVSTPGLHPRWKALIHERAAVFHLGWGDKTLGRYLLTDTLRFYSLWGAKAKVSHLTQTYPELGRETTISKGSGAPALDGDAASLWKISQAVSREIDVERLMSVVIQAVIENAGARRGWLLLRGEAGWQVVARGNSDGEALAFSNEATPESEGIPTTLLTAAEGTDRGLLVSSALEDPRFSADPLVTARQLKSVLALRFSPPGSQLRALWYFENDLVEGAFSADRLAGLRLLSGQIGISLENARIYRALTDLNRDLEGKVRDRTAELEERNRQFHHSLEYAGVLQRSLLPRDWGSSVAEKVALWVPKDIVGGDLYWFRDGLGSSLLALVDCTGHGVPGALITVLVHSILDEVWASTPAGDLAAFLTKANQLFRRALGQDKPCSESNDGFDIGLLWWPHNGDDLRFAGARIPLIVATAEGATWYHSGRKGLGYPETIDAPTVAVQAVPRVPGARYFLTSDGFLGQVGGKKNISFGRERFSELLVITAALTPEAQHAALKEALDAYRGSRPQADDLSVVGVALK